MTDYNFISGTYTNDNLVAIAAEVVGNEDIEPLFKQTGDRELCAAVLDVMTKATLKKLVPDISEYYGHNWKKEDAIGHILAPFHGKWKTKEVAAEPTQTITKGKTMKAKKLTKSQIWEKIEAAVKAATDNEGNLFGTANTFLGLLDELKPKQGGGTSTKVNEDGEVWCNYFETYLPAGDFKTKKSKPDAEGNRKDTYKANSITAEEILRKVKTVKGTTESLAMEYFRAGKINEEGFNHLLDTMEKVLETKYPSASKVPAVPTIFKEAGIEL